jgi:opacity protein-like surface antigen
MKRCFLIFALIAITATGAFAQISFSAGGGVLMDMSFGNGTKVDIKMPYVEQSGTSGMRNISFGPYLFFDATFAEAALYLSFGSLTPTYEGESGDESLFATQFGFTLLGKYPIDLGTITVFPLLGISYNIPLSISYKGESMDDPTDYSQFGLLVGGGLDYNLNSNLYIRGQLMLQMRFASKVTSDRVDEAEKYKKEMESYGMKVDKYDVSTTLGFGPVIRIGIGYRF